MKVIILAGGSGTRLWPLSRESHPKQFLKLFENKSFLKMSYERALRLVNHQDIVIVTHKDYEHKVRNDLYPYEGYHLLLEPVRKNTGPAIALSLLYLKDVVKVGEDEAVAVLSSDHYIKPDELFVEYLRFAQGIAREGFLIAFGIKPTRPDENFGYIKAGDPIKKLDGMEAYRIERFVEKPPKEKAEKMLQEGGYFWDSGNFLFTTGLCLEEYRINAPEVYEFMQKGYKGFLESYYQLPDIAFDYLEMERTKRGAVVPMDILWSDVGSFDGLYSILEKDSTGNACKGNTVCLDSGGNLIYSSGKLVCLVDVQDMLVVEDRDAVLVTKKGSASKVRDLVKDLKEKGYKEAYHHIEKSYDWGTELLLEIGTGYRISKLSILPGKSLGLRMHMHHNRNWTVLKGTLLVSFGERKAYYTPGQSFYAYRTTPYSIKNVGFVVAELLQVSMGEYMEEDDIILLQEPV